MQMPEWLLLHLFVLLLIIMLYPYNIFHTKLFICTFNLSPGVTSLFLNGDNKHTSSLTRPSRSDKIKRFITALLPFADCPDSGSWTPVFSCYFSLSCIAWSQPGSALGLFLMGFWWLQGAGGSAGAVDVWAWGTVQKECWSQNLQAGQREGFLL